MKIAIAGAGVGGLSSAALLSDRGFDVEIFDQLSQPAPVGSGLVIQPVGQDVLAEIGIADQTIAQGNRISRMLGHEVRTGGRVLDVHYDRSGQGRNFGLAIHRAQLFDQLWQAVQQRKIPVHVGHRVTGCDAGRLQFHQQPQSAPFDLVIDALGARSPLSPMRPRRLGFGALWATVDWPASTPLPQDHLSQCYRRADKMIGIMACGQVPGDRRPKATLFWSLPRGSYASWRDYGLSRWRDEVIALWPEMQPFVEQVTAPDDLTLAQYGHGTLRNPTSPGIVHIGDSAHRASPQLGQGANMALLDALSLARALERWPISQAPQAYARARRWHVRAYQLASAVFTPMYQSHSRILPPLRDRVLFPLSQMVLVRGVLTHLVCGTMLNTGTDPGD